MIGALAFHDVALDRPLHNRVGVADHYLDVVAGLLPRTFNRSGRRDAVLKHVNDVVKHAVL